VWAQKIGLKEMANSFSMPTVFLRVDHVSITQTLLPTAFCACGSRLNYPNASPDKRGAEVSWGMRFFQNAFFSAIRIRCGRTTHTSDPKKISQSKHTAMSGPQQLCFPQPMATTLTERYKQDQLDQLLTRPDIIAALQKKKPTSVELAFGADRIRIMASLQAYHRKGRRGTLKAKYHYAKHQKAGRLYVGGVGMQNMRSLVRQMLVPEGIRDYDFENSAPTLLAYLCKLMNHPCPILDDYLQEREEYLAKLPYTREEAKQLVLSIMFGAKLPPEAQSSWLKDFHKEFISIRDAVCKHFPEIYKVCKNKKNAKASTMSRVVFQIENMCLGALRDYASKEKLTMRSLIFDGLLVEGEMDCEAASEYVKAKTGVPLKVSEKPIVRRTVEEMALFLGLPATLDTEAASPEEDTSNTYLPPDLLLDIEGKWITVEAGMNMGKTERTMQLVKHYVQRGKRVLFITQRISMASAIFERLLRKERLTVLKDGETVPLFVDYNDTKGPISADYAICEYESIHRLTGHYDLVVMDEFRSLIETIQSPTNGLKTLHHWDKLKSLTLQSEKNLFLCADMSFDGAAEDVLQMLIKHEALQKSAALEQEARSIKVMNKGQQERYHALVMEAFRLKEELPEVYRIVSKVQKMKRHNIIMDNYSAVSRASSLLREGKRIALCCGSIKEANRLSAFMRGVIPHEKIGLYTGLTDNKKDVKELVKCWDQFDCIIFTSTITTGADYTTAIDSIFMFPSANTCTPRDMCQMAGRLRKLTSGNIYVAVHDYPYQACSSEDISNAFKAELQRLEGCSVTLGKVLQDTSSELRHTLPPDVLARSYTETPHDLLIIGAYSTAEKSFCRTMDDWMSVYLYMSEKKGYTTKSCDWYVSDEERDEMDQFFKEQRMQAGAAEHRLMAKMDVGLFRDDHKAFRQLTKLASGLHLTKEELAELDEKCHERGCTLPDPHTERPQLKLFKDKTDVARMFNTKELSSIDRKFVKRVKVCSSALRIHDMHEHFNDDSARLTDFLLTMQHHDVPELRKPHLVPVYMHLNELLQAMGYTGLDDRETVATSSAYNEERVATALRQLVALGVAVRSPGKSDTDMVRSVLKTQAGLECEEGSPLKVSKLLAELLAEKPPCSTAWFEDKWGSAPPEKDQFDPVALDTAQGLAALQEQYANFKGEVFDRLRAEMRARRREVQREQSRKRRVHHDAEWESYKKRARVLPPPRLHRTPARTTKRRITSITVVSYNSPSLSTAQRL
jgi:Origin of replication binding protein